MADGDNLIIGASNNGDRTTLLTRDGVSTNTGFTVRNLNGPGLQAVAAGNTPGMPGIHAESNQGTGVFAISHSASPSVAAVEAESQGPAVRARADRGAGVEALSRMSYGVKAEGSPAGVFGVSRNPDSGTGVMGVARTGVRGSGEVIGVFGEHRSAGGLVPSSFTNIGVGGRSNAHHGVVGLSDARFIRTMVCAGVFGQSENDVGVFGESLAAQFGTYGRCHPTGGVGVLGESRAGVGIAGISACLAGQFQGNVFIRGNLWVTGGKSAVVRCPDGSSRALYAVESPESWFEDFGSARLLRGRARVRLKRDFASVIRTADYHVFLTPEGDSRGLYVTRKSSGAFEVVEQQGGRSTLRFSFRVVARRPDLRGKRLTKVPVPSPLQGVEREVLPPGRSPAFEIPAPLKARRKSRKKTRSAST